MSFSKSISFPVPPSGFKVSFIGKPDIPVEKSSAVSTESYNRGKAEATSFYQAEIKKLREELATQQRHLLDKINQKVVSTLGELNVRLPDLVIRT